MRPADRWPLHPAPADGEALSSWLRRIAFAYDMDLPDLLRHGLEEPDTTSSQLDAVPPPALLDRLSQRTGVPADRIDAMSLAGWVPWLFDTTGAQPGVDVRPGAFDVYVRQFSILLKHQASPRHRTDGWQAWIPAQPQQRACPYCLADRDLLALPLMGQLPLMLSCPGHGCLLEPILAIVDRPIWAGVVGMPRLASDSVVIMDQYTQQALATGRVDLPRRTVHAAVWFRLLRTLLHELSLPATAWGSRADALRRIWDHSGFPVRAGLTVWRPFEILPWTVQAQLLAAAATTVHLLRTGLLAGRGAETSLFTPWPSRVVHPGRLRIHPAAPRPVLDSWVALRVAAEEALHAARADPDAARALHAFLLTGCRDVSAVDRLRADLIELGVPAEHLSHKSPTEPFTALSL